MSSQSQTPTESRTDTDHDRAQEFDTAGPYRADDITVHVHVRYDEEAETYLAFDPNDRDGIVGSADTAPAAFAEYGQKVNRHFENDT